MNDGIPPPSFPPAEGGRRPRADEAVSQRGKKQSSTPEDSPLPDWVSASSTPMSDDSSHEKPAPPSYLPRSGAPSPSGGPESTSVAPPTPPSLPPAYPTSRNAPQQASQPLRQQAPSFHPTRKSAPTLSSTPTPPQRGATKTSPSAWRRPRPRVTRRRVMRILAVLVVAMIAWPVWLVWHTNQSLHRVDAISGAPNTPGTTYIFAGSDSREGWNPDDPTEGERADSTILVHRAPNGQASMVSLPRDTYVDIPGYGWNKLNAAFALGGPPLLVETVEQITGLTVDHYVQIGMAGVSEIVDALGGVELCWDSDVNDELSGMMWIAGCHVADGTEALAFSRMRYSDPDGDFGRAMRQRQVMNAVVSEAFKPSVLLNPLRQYELSTAGANALTVDENAGVITVARLMLTMRSATSAGLTGVPPLAGLDMIEGVGSVVLLNESAADIFFERMVEGDLTQADFVTF